MKLFCLFIILMSYVDMQMAGPAYPGSPPYNSGGYLQGQAYSSSDSYNTGHSAYYSQNAAAPYNSGQTYFPSGAGHYSGGQTYSHGNGEATYGQAYSSGSAGSSYNPGQSSSSAGASSNAGQSLEGQLLQIMVPQSTLEDFEYMPTDEGYRFSYKLTDGTTREEVGFIMNPGGDNQDLASNDDDKSGSRPRGMVKSRKLSPKSLQSLAG